MDRPLDYNLSDRGVEVIGLTRSRDELIAFADRLKELAELLPTLCDPPTDEFITLPRMEME